MEVTWLGAVAVFVVLGLLSAAVGAQGWRTLAPWIRTRLEARRSRSWPSTTGEIVHSEVGIRGVGPTRRGHLYTPEVRYRYEVDGHEHFGQRVAFVEQHTQLQFAEGTVQITYPPGTSVQVWYDPAHPERAVLSRTSPIGCLRVTLGLTLLGAATGFLALGIGLSVAVGLLGWSAQP